MGKLTKGALSVFFVVLCSGCVGLGKKSHGSALNSSEYTFIRGINLYQKGMRNEALEEYEKAYKKDPKNKVILKELGILYSEFNNLDRSIEYTQKAYEVDKNDIDTLKNLSYLYYLKKDHDSASKYLGKIPNGDHDDFVVKLSGYILSAKGNYQAAYSTLININEDVYDKKFYDELINVHLKLNKQKDILNLMKNKYIVYNKEREFILQYAKLENMGHYPDEKTASKKILSYISEFDGDDTLYLELTKAYLRSKDINNAKNAFGLISDESLGLEEYQTIEKMLKKNMS